MQTSVESRNPEDILLELKELYKIYIMGSVEVQALRGIDLTIEKGEFISIMGTSGSGKSTLMNIIGCLDRPTKGNYFLEGIDIKEKSEDELSFIRNQKIGFVFQSFNLIARTSAVKKCRATNDICKDACK
jgi:ABC-type antimicrobial peptide transport system, ATPase component